MKTLSFPRISAAPAVLGCVLAFGAPLGAAHAAPFASHEATYRVSLAKTNSSAGLQAVRGAMQYSFADNCDGWVSENAIAVEYIYETGESLRSTWTFSSWEAKAGDKMRFAVTEKADGRITDQFAGRVEVDPEGAEGGTAWFDASGADEEKIVKLPPGTLLPTRHLRMLFNAASGGPPVILRTVFDGTSKDNPYAVNTVIGRGRGAADMAGAGAPGALLTYPMRFAFFPFHNISETPDFEMTVHYREDGVAERAVQDFENFSIALEPDGVRFIETGGC